MMLFKTKICRPFIVIVPKSGLLHWFCAVIWIWSLSKWRDDAAVSKKVGEERVRGKQDEHH